MKSDITKKAETTPSQELTNLEGMTNQTYLPGDRRSHTPAIAIGVAISVGVCGLLADRSVERVTAGQSATPISVNGFGADRSTADFTESYSTNTSSKRVPSVLPLATQPNRTADTLQNPYVRQLPTQIARTFTTSTSRSTTVAAQPDSIEISVPSPKNNKIPVRYGQRQLVSDPYLSHSGIEHGTDFSGEEDRPTTGQPAIGFAWPAQGSLTSKYGRRWGRMHKGIDIAGPVGTPIAAAAEGTVIFAGWSSGGYGNLIEIRHNDGSTTRYGHNSRLLVSVGQQVRQNQQVAEMGSTGRSTGSHLHFEIRTGGISAVNPMAYLPSSR